MRQVMLKAALVLLGLSLVPGLAQAAAKPVVYEGTALLLKTFPDNFQVKPEAASLRLKTGVFVDVLTNPFGPALPCWYAPSLNVAGVCQTRPGSGVVLTVLVDLISGHRFSGPGHIVLTPDPALIAVGPAGPQDDGIDSMTLYRLTPTGLVEEGGADFGDDYAPGGWVDAGCYRLKAKGQGPSGWLEKTASQGWVQAGASNSTICQKRHGG